MQERVDEAVDSFGFRDGTPTGVTRLITLTSTSCVFVRRTCCTSRLRLLQPEAGKHVFCEKPVGGTPEQTVRIEAASRAAGIITGVGYNYRWAPLVQYAKQLIADGTLGEITNYNGRFFTMYGSDPMGLLSWRFNSTVPDMA